MRILQVTSVYYPELQFGGPPQKIHALSRGLAARGHQVQVVTLAQSQRSANHQTTVEGISVQYLPWVGRGAWQAPVSWRPLVEAVRWAEVVHGYGLYNLLTPMAERQARAHQRPLVLEPQGMYTPRGRSQALKRLYHRLFTHHLFETADTVIATSSTEQDDLARIVVGSRLQLRRNGIDPVEFNPLPDRSMFRHSQGVESDARIVLFLGRISPIKNIEQLILAFWQARLPATYLVLAGPTLEPDYERRVQQLIQSLDLKERVLLTGALFGQAKLAALASADLFVLPSIFESFGNAAAEAVAAGLPVLVTNRCGIADLIHERAGLAVPVTVEGLRNGMIEMLTTPLRERSTRHRSEVINELTWEQPLRQMEQLYRSLIDTNRHMAS